MARNLMAENAIEIDQVTKIFKLYKEKRSRQERVIRRAQSPHPVPCVESVSFDVAQARPSRCSATTGPASRPC